ncbi:Uncharacterised protein g3843 [Pycnogonum litorale]
MMSFTAILAVILTLTSVHTVKLKKIVVPSPVLAGSDVKLRCIFDFNRSDISVIKWYKDEDEFFRFTPSRNQTKTFKTNGVNLDKTKSTGEVIVLKNVSLSSNGTYKCEESGDRPHFITKSKIGKMIVYSLPDDPPKVIGLKRNYKVGDKIRLNCTSPPSYPAPKLYWYINNKPVNDVKSKSYQRVLDSSLQVVSKSLVFTAVESLFSSDRKIEIRCRAVIGNYHDKSSSDSIHMCTSYSDDPGACESVAYSTSDKRNTAPKKDNRPVIAIILPIMFIQYNIRQFLIS